MGWTIGLWVSSVILRDSYRISPIMFQALKLPLNMNQMLNSIGHGLTIHDECDHAHTMLVRAPAHMWHFSQSVSTHTAARVFRNAVPLPFPVSERRSFFSKKLRYVPFCSFCCSFCCSFLFLLLFLWWPCCSFCCSLLFLLLFLSVPSTVPS